MPGFQELSGEAKTDFFRSLTECQGGREIEAVVTDTTTTARTNHQSTDFSGEWSPLSVWANCGWGPELINDTANASC